MKKFLVLLFFVWFISGCSNHKSELLVSPSNGYFLQTSVNRTDKSLKNYAYILLHLYNERGEFLHTLNTRAGDFSAWKISWDENTDTILMYSGDIGNLAFTVEEDQLIPLKEVPLSLSEKIEGLRDSKK